MMTYRIANVLSLLMAVLFVAGGLVACGGDEDEGGTVSTPALKDQPLQGQIKGNDWAWTAGEVETTGDEFDFEFYDGPESDCSFDTSNHTNEWHLQVQRFPEGDTREELINPVSAERDGPTLLYTKGEGSEARNVILTNGFVEITSITETTIEGSIVGKANDTSINGNFDVTRCSNQGDGEGSGS